MEETETYVENIIHLKWHLNSKPIGEVNGWIWLIMKKPCAKDGFYDVIGIEKVISIFLFYRTRVDFFTREIIESQSFFQYEKAYGIIFLFKISIGIS